MPCLYMPIDKRCQLRPHQWRHFVSDGSDTQRFWKAPLMFWIAGRWDFPNRRFFMSQPITVPMTTVILEVWANDTALSVADSCGTNKWWERSRILTWPNGRKLEHTSDGEKYGLRGNKNNMNPITQHWPHSCEPLAITAPSVVLSTEVVFD